MVMAEEVKAIFEDSRSLEVSAIDRLDQMVQRV